MQIQVKPGEIAATRAGAIIVGYFEDRQIQDDLIKAIDHALGGAISGFINEGEIKGKASELTLIHTLGKLPAGRALVVGLGKSNEVSTEKVRCAMAAACRFLQQKGVAEAATVPLGAGMNNISPEQSAQALTEGAVLGLYTFRTHITHPDDDSKEIKELTIIARETDAPALGAAAARGKILAEAAITARDMVNEPGNFMTPTAMADKARQLATAYGLQVEVLEREQMQALGMGALLGVAQGSQQPPKFIIMHYKGSQSTGIDLALVGKGITFDSGGISIKPAEKMGDMKGDMAGGAAVMMALAAIAQLKPKINISALVPATENMPGGRALKPGDILTAMNGKTMEIITTDAEGRLILADALSYARKIGAKAIVDVATLTGACVVALGDVCSGAFTNNQPLMDRLAAAAGETGEKVWQMPMFDEYNQQIKSSVADIKNSGGRNAGAITAAKFLAEFIDSTPWVHLDIAGTSMADKERGYIVKGATGVPVRTLVNLALSMGGE